jgi:membrane protein YqaA with SNARE-associated domain
LLQSLYAWTLEKAAHRHAIWWLLVLSFAEASFFPVPADVMLAPMVFAARRRWLVLAATCTAASVLGGCFGYGIGYFLFETVGRWLVDLYSSMEQFARVQEAYNEHGVLIVLIGALTPVPYKIVTIASGVAQMDFAAFTATSFVGRGARYFAVAGLFFVFGPWIKKFMDENLKLAVTAFTVLLVGGFAILALL